MRVKILTLVMLCILLAGAGNAYQTDYPAMLAKYGPVPEAILEPPVDEVLAREKNSLLAQIFGSNSSSRHGILARTKACYANQRVTLGAIEMYNMDNATMYKTLVLRCCRSGRHAGDQQVSQKSSLSGRTWLPSA